VGNPYAPPPREPEERPPAPPSPQWSDKWGEERRPPPDRPTARRRDEGRAPARPDPARAARAARRVGAVGVLALAALLASSLPLPWSVASVALSAAAVGVGVAAIAAMRGTSVRRTLLPPLALGLGVNVLILASSLSMLATWPIQQARQECLSRAITISARDACETAYRRALDELRTPPSP
jgi:hypothetical protein